MAESDDNGKRFVSFMSNHLVALTGNYRSFNKGRLYHEGVYAFSGFVMEFHENWYWTTAGHCLEAELDRRIQRGELDLISSGFADYFGSNVRSVNIIPYTYEIGCSFRLDDSKLGMDFALIPLPDLIRLALEHNGITPVSRANWVQQKKLEFSHYKMLGFPVSDAHDAGIRPVMVAIDRLQPDEIDEPETTWFVGRINAGVRDFDIKGMSGGPIYGFRKAADGRWYYHVIAIQSRWIAKKRIVFGCSLPLFAERVDKLLTPGGNADEQQ